MPELPEVHTTATMLDRLARGCVIHGVWTDYDSAFNRGKSNIKDRKYFKLLKKTITGKKIIGVRRRAKNVLIDLSSNVTILIHMKMTGHILYGKYEKASVVKKEIWKTLEKGPLEDPFNQFIHFVLTLDNGKHVALSDVRKFAKVLFFETNAPPENLLELGPEPLEREFSLKKFIERLSLRQKGKIKQVLLDQTVIAGIGNIYSDESLWYSKIHPESRVERIPHDILSNLFTSVKHVLRDAIKSGGDSLSDYRNPRGEKGGYQNFHKAYQQTGKKCRRARCGGTIRRIIIGGRSGHFCDTHQKKY